MEEGSIASLVSRRRREDSKSAARLSAAAACKGRKVLGRGFFGMVCSRKGKAVKVQFRCSPGDTFCKIRNKKEIQFFKQVARLYPDFFMQLYNVEIDRDFYVLELEKMDGTFMSTSSSVMDPMKKTRTFFMQDSRRVCVFLLQLFSALNFMRAKGFNHTDLHPGNIAFVNTRNKYMDVFPYYQENMKKQQGFQVPTFGRKWKIIDYGLITRPTFGLVDERMLFPRFLVSWRLPESTSNDDSNPFSGFDDFPLLDIEQARARQPQKVSFVESFAPPHLQRVGEASMFMENDFNTAYELMFGTDDLLELLLPDADDRKREQWKSRFGIQESMVSKDELLFYYHAKTKIEDVLIPYLLDRLG